MDRDRSQPSFDADGGVSASPAVPSEKLVNLKVETPYTAQRAEREGRLKSPLPRDDCDGTADRQGLAVSPDGLYEAETGGGTAAGAKEGQSQYLRRVSTNKSTYADASSPAWPRHRAGQGPIRPDESEVASFFGPTRSGRHANESPDATVLIGTTEVAGIYHRGSQLEVDAYQRPATTAPATGSKRAQTG